MKYVKSTFIDKKNRNITIRAAKKGDAQGLIECISQYVKDSNHQVLLNEEFKPSLIEENKWISSFTTAENSLLLVAEYNGKIIGNIDVKGGSKERIKHTAIVGMGLSAEFRNYGLGKFLMQEIISWCKQNPILELLWLQVFGNHAVAINLYSSLGFEKTGEQLAFIKYDEDHYTSKVIMSLVVK